MNVQQVRAQVPALRNFVWFQNGFVSLTPTPIAEEHIRLMRELHEGGPMHLLHPEVEYPRRAASMARIARFLSVAPSELALKHAVSDGYHTLLHGLEWRRGDQIIITEEEQAALLVPALHLRDALKVEVVKVPLVNDIEGQVQAFEERITARTRLIAISHVTTDRGYRLPVTEICRTARSRGVLTFLDMAHSIGLYPIDLYEVGCDFAGILSYKWTYAPYSVGALYVRQDRVGALRQIPAPSRAARLLDHETEAYEVPQTAEQFQSGPWSWPLVHTWAFALDWLTGIGRDSIWERTLALTGRLKSALRQVPGVVLHTPEAPELSAALVCFSLDGWDGPGLAGALKARWNIEIKALPLPKDSLRASIAFFLLEDEIDLLADAVRTLAAEGPARRRSPVGRMPAPKKL